MHFSKIAVAATAVGSVSAAGPSICDKYTTALLKQNTPANQFALVSLLVKTAGVGSFTGKGSPNPSLPGSTPKITGFLTPGTVNGEMVNLMPYFNGEFLSSNVNGAPGSVNWLDSNSTLLATDPLSLGLPGTNTLKLLTHLTQYFGVLLGCTGYGKTGFSAYAGDNSQYNVHKFMDLSEAEFTYFVEAVGNSAKSFGASSSDIMAAATALNMTFGYRCAPAAMVAPNTPMEMQAICQDASCPLSPNATCSGDAAAPGFVASEPASTMLPTGTGMMTSPTGTSTPAPFNPNSASKTAGAGFLAAIGAVVAALL